MLRQISAGQTSFRLNRPFRISRGTKTAADVVTVEITQGGVIGRGEGVPYARYDETLDSALQEIERARIAIEAGVDRRGLLDLMPAGAGRNAVDCALWDLEAKLAGKSVSELVGWPEPAPVATAMTVGIDTPANMAAAALVLHNVPLLKVKVDDDDPLAALRAVREVAPTPRLIVDPNESWSMQGLADRQAALAGLKVDLLEQPLPAGEDAELEGFAPLVPLAADESGHVWDDIPQIARRYQVINIKLDKTGGLTTAFEVSTAAQQAGLQLMVGCMVSSSLSIAPALVLAQRCAFIDLDGPTWLAADRPHGVKEVEGVMTPAAQGFWGSP
ncbi:N-acetyl-D-Glu racemase DgcA [Erythrobacter sp. AP23]|uniref:N-acetyl-D-Glu racemase DgcA n=1 Tax=Erythrobacter sp. AP23 TaxID=499656 RepID=UPI00076D6AE1|nr:N-acetyl-D-Glu racemase DgcA [Erythrobacter sp. AP23]KWV92433.1 dipeptide epimerase [Erythrobacter sp. AP23]